MPTRFRSKRHFKIIADTIKLYTDNLHPLKGEITLPEAYSKVVSSDANFEVVTCVEAKKLTLERQDDVVGHKRLIFTIDNADDTREGIRKVVVDFFKNILGFKDEDIAFINRTEFEEDEDGVD
jgi:hypothetical protein